LLTKLFCVFQGRSESLLPLTETSFVAHLAQSGRGVPKTVPKEHSLTNKEKMKCPMVGKPL